MEPKYYRLNDSQETLMIQQTFSFSKNVMQLPICVTTREKIDFNLLNDAVNIEIERNDCLRLRFKKVEGKWRQYFLPEYRIEKIKVYDFSEKGEEAQEKFLKKEAAKIVKFKKDDVIHIVFFKSFDGQSGIFINVCHLNMDGVAVMAFIRDLFDVYKALKGETEMPKPICTFEEMIVNDEKRCADTEKMAKSEEFFRDFFAKDGELIYLGVQGSEFLRDRRERKKNPEPRAEKIFDPIRSKSGHICIKEEKEFLEKLNSLAERFNVSAQCIVEAAIRTYLSKINDFGKDVFFQSLHSGRNIKEKRSGGCKMNLVPIRTIVEENESFIGVAKKISLMHLKMYKLRCPRSFWADILAKMYPLRPMYDYYSMLFNWMVMPAANNTPLELDLRWISTGHFASELYTFIFPDLRTGGIKFNYEFQLHRITKENIAAFHENVVGMIEKAYEEPEITVGKLMREKLNTAQKKLCFAE